MMAIEQQTADDVSHRVADLRAAGWVRESPHEWRSLNGVLYVGLSVAHAAMKRIEALKGPA